MKEPHENECFRFRAGRSTAHLAFFLLLFFVSGSVLYSSQKQEQDWAAQLPEDEGKELLVSLCTACHSLETTVKQRKSRKEWRNTVDDMIGRGAQIFSDEAESIVDYLTKHRPPLNPAPKGPPGAGVVSSH